MKTKPKKDGAKLNLYLDKRVKQKLLDMAAQSGLNPGAWVIVLVNREEQAQPAKTQPAKLSIMNCEL